MNLYVLFNHLFLSVDPVTYQDIMQSDFLQSEFAVFETRTTIRRDYPDGYTGAYFYGQQTYFEFFDAGNSAFPLGNFGIATGFETEGQVDGVVGPLDALGGSFAYNADRQTAAGTAVEWFRAISGPQPSGFGGHAVWAMEYQPSFIGDWLGAGAGMLGGSILQKDILTAYARTLDKENERNTMLLKDIVSLKARFAPASLEAYSAQFQAFGWSLSITPEKCHYLEARNTSLTLCPASAQAPATLHEIGFALSRDHQGPAEMRFGNSVLRFSGDTALWQFDLPMP